MIFASCTTDYAILDWLTQFKNREGEIARWLERMQTYVMDIEHCKGGLHGYDDTLSRRPYEVESRHCSRADLKEGIMAIRQLSIYSTERWSSELVIKNSFQS